MKELEKYLPTWEIPITGVLGAGRHQPQAQSGDKLSGPDTVFHH